MLKWLLVFLLLPFGVQAGDVFEPARGTELRANLMAAIRPHAEWNLGKPVEFVIRDLRVSGDVAYGSIEPQRPGGAVIDILKTPMMERGEIDPEFDENTYIHVLYQKSGRVWVAVHWTMGATDVWFAAPEFCEIWGPVTAEFCS